MRIEPNQATITHSETVAVMVFARSPNLLPHLLLLLPIGCLASC